MSNRGVNPSRSEALRKAAESKARTWAGLDWVAGSCDLLRVLDEQGWAGPLMTGDEIAAHLWEFGPRPKGHEPQADANGELVAGREASWVPPSDAVRAAAKAAFAYLFEGTGLCLSADASKGTFYAFRFMLRNVFDEPAGMIELGGCLTCRKDGRPSVRFELTGLGCALLEQRGDASADHAQQWCALRAKLERVDALLSRVDVAFDDFDGERSVKLAETMWEVGEFDYRFGPEMLRPKAKGFKDYGSGEGNTFYVGSSSSEKQLRVYEKGKQLGDAESPWVRWEIQFRGSTRKRLALRVLDDPMPYMRGAFQCLEFVSRCMERFEATGEARKACVKSTLRHAKRMYGGTLWQLAALAPNRESMLDVIEFLKVENPPRWAKTGRSNWGDVAGLLSAPDDKETKQ